MFDGLDRIPDLVSEGVAHGTSFRNGGFLLLFRDVLFDIVLVRVFDVLEIIKKPLGILLVEFERTAGHLYSWRF